MSSKTIGFANSKTETFFERHAWKVLLFFGLFMSLIGLPFGPLFGLILIVLLVQAWKETLS